MTRELMSAKKKIYKTLKSRIPNVERVKRVHEDGSSTSDQRNMKLVFKNRISQTILTGEEIKGDENTCIELNLVDSTGEIVDIGPESSANVEIVLLKGKSGASESLDNWTIEEFDDNIARDAQGKMSFLTGDMRIKLEKGVAELNNIKIRNHATKTKPPVLKLGARAVETSNRVHIREAKTEPFTVKIYREKYFKKNEFPFLSNEVYRLTNIRKGGAYHKRLKEKSINTVEDFLVKLMRDPKGLQNLMKLRGKKFAASVEHARRCQIGQKMFYYMDSVQGIGVVFNILGTILGLYNEHQYTMADSLSENHKVVAEGLFKLALRNWEDTVSVNNDIAPDAYFAGLIRPSLEPLPSHEQSCNNNIAICETIGESSDTQMDSPLQNFDSLMNYPNEEAVATELEDDHSFCVDDMEMDCDPPLQHSPCCHFNIETTLQEFEEFLRQKSWKKLSYVFKCLSIGKKKEGTLM